MESFFNKGRTSRERFSIIIFILCDGNKVVCEFTAELNGLNGFQQRGDHNLHQHKGQHTHLQVLRHAV